MTGVTGQGTMPAPCPKCTGRGDAHYLTCSTLRLPALSEFAAEALEWAELTLPTALEGWPEWKAQP